MTESEIAYAIINEVTSHEGVTDFPVAIDQVRDEVDTLRIRVFDEQDLQTRYTISLEPFLQTIESTDTKYDAVKKITTLKVPLIHIRQNGKAAIRFCGSSSYTTPFRIVTGNHFLYASHDKYIGNAPTVHYENGLLRFFNTRLKKVVVKAIFSDPSDLAIHGYNFEKDEYPVPGGFADIIKGKTVESYLRTMYRIPIQPNAQVDMPNARL